jgi:hypothetical protein
LGNFWPYLWHIYKKTIVQLAFFGRQIVPSDKMSHFLPGDKMSQLMHLCTGKLWKVVGTFCWLSHLNMYWTYLGYILTTFWAVLGLYWASHQDSENIAQAIVPVILLVFLSLSLSLSL